MPCSSPISPWFVSGMVDIWLGSSTAIVSDGFTVLLSHNGDFGSFLGSLPGLVPTASKSEEAYAILGGSL